MADSKKIQEIYTALLGIPNTDDRGMAGAINKIEKHLEVLNKGQEKQNVKIATNIEAIENNRKGINRIWTVGLSVLGGSGVVAAIVLKALGVY